MTPEASEALYAAMSLLSEAHPGDRSEVASLADKARVLLQSAVRAGAGAEAAQLAADAEALASDIAAGSVASDVVALERLDRLYGAVWSCPRSVPLTAADRAALVRVLEEGGNRPVHVPEEMHVEWQSRSVVGLVEPLDLLPNRRSDSVGHMRDALGAVWFDIFEDQLRGWMFDWYGELDTPGMPYPSLGDVVA